jgi:hypothetical protein
VPQGKPVLLIGFNEASRTWEVNPDAVKLLERVPGPLCTVAVCGRARQGKSFLLNTMLGRLTGQVRCSNMVGQEWCGHGAILACAAGTRTPRLQVPDL